MQAISILFWVLNIRKIYSHVGYALFLFSHGILTVGIDGRCMIRGNS